MEITDYLKPSNFYFNYPSPKELAEITQGDIFFIDEIMYIIITNACDLEIRNGERKAEYIHFTLLQPISDDDFKTFKNHEWANITGQNDNSVLYLPFQDYFGIEPCRGFIIHTSMIYLETIAQFLQRDDVIIISRLIQPYLDLLSWKIGYLFNRIPVDQPGKVDLKNWYDKLKAEIESNQ